MDGRWLGGPRGERSRRQGTPKASHHPSTRPGAAGEAVSGTRLFGRIDAVHPSPDGGLVDLFRGMEIAVRVPASFFPSLDWAKAHVGRWVALNGQADGARIMPHPAEICGHSTDPLTGELRLSCSVCGAEMGRLPPRTQDMVVRELTGKIAALLETHLATVHPEIKDVLSDPWRTP